MCTRLMCSLALLIAACPTLGCARSDRIADEGRNIELDDVLVSNDVSPALPREITPSPFVQPVLQDRPLDPYTMQYNPTTVITLRGGVLGFRRISLEDDRTGLYVRISGGGDLLWVYLGPEQWLIDHGVRPDMTEQFTVTGSMITTEGERLMVAREITIDGLKVELRDELGTPNWSPRLEPPPPPKRTQAEVKERRREYLEKLLSRHEQQAAEIRQALRSEGWVR